LKEHELLESIYRGIFNLEGTRTSGD